MSGDLNDWLAAAARRTAGTRDVPDVVVVAVRGSRMDPEQAALDDLLPTQIAQDVIASPPKR